jgi:hypothetical protein
MDEIGRIDCKNDECIVYWDSEENTARIQMDHDFMRLGNECSVQQTLEHIFGVKKNIGDLVLNRTRPGIPHEFAFVGNSTWKQIMERKVHVWFRVYNVDLAA